MKKQAVDTRHVDTLRAVLEMADAEVESARVEYAPCRVSSHGLSILATLIDYAEAHSKEDTLDYLSAERETWETVRLPYLTAVRGTEGASDALDALSVLEDAWDALTGVPMEVIARRYQAGE